MWAGVGGRPEERRELGGAGPGSLEGHGARGAGGREAGTLGRVFHDILDDEHWWAKPSSESTPEEEGHGRRELPASSHPDEYS